MVADRWEAGGEVEHADMVVHVIAVPVLGGHLVHALIRALDKVVDIADVIAPEFLQVCTTGLIQDFRKRRVLPRIFNELLRDETQHL